MERTVSAPEAGRQFDQLLAAVARGDQVIVERAGEPVAAVVPMAVYERLKQTRTDGFDLMRKAAERANMSEEEADALALEAVAAVRAEARRARATDGAEC